MILIEFPLIDSEHLYFVLNAIYSLFKWLLFFSELIKNNSAR